MDEPSAVIACSSCGMPKPEAEFYRRGLGGRRRGTCRICVCVRHKRHRNVHKEAVASRRNAWAKVNREHLKLTGQRRRLEKRAMCLVAHARIRARRKGLPCDLAEHVAEIQRKIDAGRCELSGFPFDLSGCERQFASPSLHRVNPAWDMWQATCV